MSESENTEESKTEQAELADDPASAVEARRAATKKKREQKRLAQRLIDMQAIAELEEESGLEVKTLEPQGRYVEGAPAVVAVRPPSKAEYNRYTSQLRSSKESSTKRGDAMDLLAKTCIVYPAKESDALKALFEHFPGTLNSVVMVVTKLAELESEDEKKG